MKEKEQIVATKEKSYEGLQASIREAVAAKKDLRELVAKRDDARKKWLETVEACAAMLSC